MAKRVIGARTSSSQLDIDKNLANTLTIDDRSDDDEDVVVLDPPPKQKFPKLTAGMMLIIKDAKRQSKLRGRDQTVVEGKITITRGDIVSLHPDNELNDNVINAYMRLIVLRSQLDNFNGPSVYAFETHFYTKLLQEGYSNSLKRWTKNEDIFGYHLLLFPIHLKTADGDGDDHWCLAVVDFRNSSIRYYDSLGDDNYECLNSLLEYLEMEMRERKGVDLGKSEWTLKNVKGLPQQQDDSSDCGIFACQFAESLSRDEAEFTFGQGDMAYFRDRMIYELVIQEVLYP